MWMNVFCATFVNHILSITLWICVDVGHAPPASVPFTVAVFGQVEVQRRLKEADAVVTRQLVTRRMRDRMVRLYNPHTVFMWLNILNDTAIMCSSPTFDNSRFVCY